MKKVDQLCKHLKPGRVYRRDSLQQRSPAPMDLGMIAGAQLPNSQASSVMVLLANLTALEKEATAQKILQRKRKAKKEEGNEFSSDEDNHKKRKR